MADLGRSTCAFSIIFTDFTLVVSEPEETRTTTVPQVVFLLKVCFSFMQDVFLIALSDTTHCTLLTVIGSRKFQEQCEEGNQSTDGNQTME